MAQTAQFLFLLLTSTILTVGCTTSSRSGATLGFTDATDAAGTAGDGADGSDGADGADSADGASGTDNTNPLPDLPEPTGDPCVDGKRLSALVDLVVDPDPVGCPWGQGDNSEEAQGVLTARDETIARIIRTDNGAPFDFLAEGGRLCDIRLDTLTLDDNPVAADFVYDDVLLVTLNDAVVIASYAPILEQLEQTDGLYRYVWDDLRGTQLQFQSNSAYCLGYNNGSDCALPFSDTTGEFVISLGGDGFEPLKAELLDSGKLELKFITIGDNDSDTDCRHNGYRMRAVVDVALPSTFTE
jgi:hypothetical protein